MARFLRVWLALQAACAVGSSFAAPPIIRKVQSPPAGAVKLLWQTPPPMTAEDWFWGPGGKERAPIPPFQFIKEGFGGTNPKVEIRDARGMTWTVKFGPEVHSETFGTRMV